MSLSALGAPSVWLDSQEKSVRELYKEVSDPGSLKGLSSMCKKVSNTFITKSHTAAESAWETNKDAFIARTLWTYPFDDSRTARDVEGFFLNASDLHLEGQKYIASQAPLSTTVTDFWKAVIHTQAATIVALNMPAEDKDEPEPRPVEYWKKECTQEPKTFENWQDIETQNESEEVVASFDDWMIQRVKSEVVAKEEGTNFAIVKRILLAKNSETKQERLITQFHFQNWPDFEGAPTDRLFTKLLDLVDTSHQAPDIPLFVHCAAGMGRAGSFIAAHSMRRKIHQDLKKKKPEEITVNLPNTIYQMRLCRKDMVSKKGIPCIVKALMSSATGSSL